MRNKMTKILIINLIFISNRNLYHRPKDIQEEWIKNLNKEEKKQILNSICAILTTDYHFIYTTFSVLH